MTARAVCAPNKKVRIDDFFFQLIFETARFLSGTTVLFRYCFYCVHIAFAP
jgi:hypothetical protein